MTEFKLILSFLKDENGKEKNVIHYEIPALNLEAKVDYLLFERLSPEELEKRKVVNFKLLGNGHVKLEEDQRFSELVKKGFYNPILQLFLDAAFGPTAELKNSEKRVAIDYDQLLTFIQNVIDTYENRVRSVPLVGMREKKDAEALLENLKKSDSYSMAVALQNLHLCCRNPGGSGCRCPGRYPAYNCLVPEV